MTITMAQVTSAYVSSREEIRALEAQIEEIKKVQARREDYLLGELQKQGLQNVKTQSGTVYIAVKESVTVGDWDAVIDFVVAPIKEMLECSLGVGEVDMSIIKRAMRLEFLNKAVNKTAALELMGEKRDGLPPAGVNYSAVRVAQIRKN